MSASIHCPPFAFVAARVVQLCALRKKDALVMRRDSWVVRFPLRSRGALSQGVWVLFLSLFLGSRAQAAESEDALKMGHQALDEFGRGDFGEAKILFKEAERLAHSPVFVLYQARTALALKEYESAFGFYQRLIEEVLPSDAPRAWLQAQADGKAEFTQISAEYIEYRYSISPEIALPITLATGSESQRMASYYGSIVVARSAALPSAVDPRGRTLLVSLERREEKDFISVRSETAAPLKAHRHSNRTDFVPAATPKAPPYRTASYVAYTFSGGFAATSLVLGVIAVAQANTVKSGCVGGYCRPEDFSLAESAVQNADLALVGATISGAMLATGITLTLLSRKQEQTAIWATSSGSSLSLHGEF